MELKSMIDFVFYIGNLDIARKSSHKEMVTLIFNYALLLKDKLSLWMFVPCDKDGKIMEEPQSIKNTFIQKSDNGDFFNQKRFLEYIVNYDQAKSKCLFKDFDLWRSGNGFLVRNAFIKIHDVEFENVTIEYLSVQGGIYSTTPAFMNKVGL